MYSYLGPAGTFTWAALKQVPEAVNASWRSVQNVGEALDDVVSGRSTAAMIAIENSVEGGVSVAQDALAALPELRIVGEYLVPVNFHLVARPKTHLDKVRIIAAHPVAYAQCHRWLEKTIPEHGHIPSASNMAAPTDLLDSSPADAAIAPPGVSEQLPLVVLAENIADNQDAVTRFVLVSLSKVLPVRTGADKTSVIVELPSDQPGALVEMLEQFATRGVNLGLLASRPIIGDAFGRYRFIIDLDGHVTEERVADALLGLKRFSPRVQFLGSYPRADKQNVRVDVRYEDKVFREAREWLQGIISGEFDKK